jgi:hypothetical protein
LKSLYRECPITAGRRNKRILLKKFIREKILIGEFEIIPADTDSSPKTPEFEAIVRIEVKRIADK